FARTGIERFERDHVMAAETRDRSRQQSFQSLPFANLAAHVARDALIRRTAHEPERFAYAFFRKQIEKRGLPEIDGERLFQRAVENSFACRVHELREQHRVAIRESL